MPPDASSNAGLTISGKLSPTSAIAATSWITRQRGVGTPAAASSALACGLFWHSASANGRAPLYGTPSSSNTEARWYSCAMSSWNHSTRFSTASGRSRSSASISTSSESRMLSTLTSWPTSRSADSISAISSSTVSPGSTTFAVSQSGVRRPSRRHQVVTSSSVWFQAIRIRATT
jgi:hypothetical protein